MTRQDDNAPTASLDGLQEPAQVLAGTWVSTPAATPTAESLRAALLQERDTAQAKRAAYDVLPKRAPRDNASPKALAERAAKEARFMAAKSAHDAAKTQARAATLAYARAKFGPMLRPFIRAAVEALPVREWVRMGDRTLRAVLHLGVEGGVVSFDILATFDKMGLLEEVGVYRFTETGMERERAATMKPMDYLASKRCPSAWDLLWHLRSGDKLSKDHRLWSMDTRAGFALSPTDAQALAQMGEKMTALLATLDALKMPNIALLEMAASDLAEIDAGLRQPADGHYLARLEQAFPAAREARLQDPEAQAQALQAVQDNKET